MRYQFVFPFQPVDLVARGNEGADFVEDLSIVAQASSLIQWPWQQCVGR